MGKPEIIQGSKDTARYYTDEIYKLDYDLELLDKSIFRAQQDYPKRVPPLSIILGHCKNLTLRIPPKFEPEEEIREPQSNVDWEKLAAEGNPFAKNHLKWINRDV